MDGPRDLVALEHESHALLADVAAIAHEINAFRALL
jgi:hypothetical protein